jgi:hypothetical protein
MHEIIVCDNKMTHEWLVINDYHVARNEDP